ncbi:hypothetical protein AB0M44_00980 [Streptosporangium subroseum]|uniref:hypothetical protein n=1 Tax=Streptosporangium subroseum TaxID=106412 RepID=UPI00341FEF86
MTGTGAWNTASIAQPPTADYAVACLSERHGARSRSCGTARTRPGLARGERMRTWLGGTARHGAGAGAGADGTVRCGTVRVRTARCGAARCGCGRHGAVRCGTVRHGAGADGTVRCGTVRHGAGADGTVRCGAGAVRARYSVLEQGA